MNRQGPSSGGVTFPGSLKSPTMIDIIKQMLSLRCNHGNFFLPNISPPSIESPPENLVLQQASSIPNFRSVRGMREPQACRSSMLLCPWLVRSKSLLLDLLGLALPLGPLLGESRPLAEGWHLLSGQPPT